MDSEQKKNVLWKYDKELGIAYFCPVCKTFICIDKCRNCGTEVNWSDTGNPKYEYKGKVKWY